ncbi:MAG: MaoC family dehydratase [Dethiosulfatibacter sp.]|nr:MaoC family dehydratase [Dethiosulfatibacter sp.]
MFVKTISESDVYLFAGITGDFNPAHINEEYARESVFKTRIAHGMLTASLISTVLGTKLPGPGTIYLSQDTKFLKPVLIGDTIAAIVKIVDLNKEKNKVKLETICINQKNETVLEGFALVKAPK